MRRLPRLTPDWTTRLFVAGIIASLGAMGWLGYRAVSGWRHSARLLAEQRAAEIVDRLVTVLGRDMRGVQGTVLASARWNQFLADSPDDVRDLAASAFARYPYPESFFAWRGRPAAEAIDFFNRSDRRPSWMPGDVGPNRFPVIVEREPQVAARIRDRVLQDAARRRRFSIFEAALGGVRYQVVARLLYRDPLRGQLEGVLGFTVNLAWARAHYFPEVTRQVSRIGGSSSTFPLAVVDDTGAAVASSSEAPLREPMRRRDRPLMFLDPLLVALDAPPDLPRVTWAAVAGAGGDPTLMDAMQASHGMIAVATLAMLAFAVGLVLTARATHARASLAELRSDFVSAVTHELKTPIATIRAAADTMARGRVSGPGAYANFAHLIVQESRRLTRLVDNLLAYSRLTDVTEVYTWDALDPRELIGEVVAGFSRVLDTQGFTVAVDVAEDVPPIRGDRTACLLLFDNIVDNAIRYSGGGRYLGVAARRDGGAVRVEVRDAGPGIPADELPKVTRKFFRGRGAPSGGSGLGLAIAHRVATDHGGALRIESRPGDGTTVIVELPAAEPGDEDAHPGR